MSQDEWLGTIVIIVMILVTVFDIGYRLGYDKARNAYRRK